MSRPGAFADVTIVAYRRRAKRAAANWRRVRVPSRMLRRFVEMLPRGARVLDYGCGIGRELAWMRRQGCVVEGLDGTPEFVRAARRQCPGVAVRLARFETVRMARGRYDGIWCNAALMHVPPAELRRQLRRLRQALRPAGVLGLTLSWGRSRRAASDPSTRAPASAGGPGSGLRDWIPGRYIACYSKPEVAGMLRGWVIRELRVVSNVGRKGRWVQAIAVCVAALPSSRHA